MSREDDLDTIMRLLPSPPWLNPENSRHKLETLSDEELSESRASLESISEQERSPRWKAALEKVRGVSRFKSLLEE